MIGKGRLIPYESLPALAQGILTREKLGFHRTEHRLDPVLSTDIAQRRAVRSIGRDLDESRKVAGDCRTIDVVVAVEEKTRMKLEAPRTSDGQGPIVLSKQKDV